MSLTYAAECLREAEAVTMDAVEEDQDEEIEALKSTFEIEDRQAINPEYLRSPPESPKRQKFDTNILVENLKKASEDIILVGTREEYNRLWGQFKVFCQGLGYVEHTEDIDMFGKNVPADFPQWIAIWIMDKADENDICTGKTKDPSRSRVTYATAQKMRAAISHKFGRDYELGTQAWTENPSSPGTFIGNPSLSVIVSQYMISLRRRKVRAGQSVTSARAMDHETMKLLFDYNMTFPDDKDGKGEGSTRKHKKEHPEEWGGKSIRIMLQLLYTVSMHCLLRYDEALRISWGDVFFERMENGRVFIRLELPFRKTHQNGGIAPFWLYPDLERPWMCPVRLFASWWALVRELGVEPQGYVFRKKIGKNKFSVKPGDGMSADSFMECFRNNLLDVSVDPRPYGTHSFRRGGCQYLSLVKRWPFRRICEWAGWAENFDNPGTLFKYLLSWNDAPTLDRKDYLNPFRRQTDACTHCGRTCDCGY